MIKRGLDLILDVVEAARVRLTSSLQFGSESQPLLGDSQPDIVQLLVQALVETKFLLDQRVRLSQLSNEKGSRRIVAFDYALPCRTIEIRESVTETPEESSMIFVRDDGSNQSGSPVRLDADGLFNFAKAILSWFGFEPTRSSDLGVDGEAIAEWLRVEAQSFRTKAEELGTKWLDGVSLQAASLEAKADDYEELATRISAGAWKVKPS